MNKFIQTLRVITLPNTLKSIKEELEQNVRSKNSAILNTILEEKYPELIEKECSNSKNCLLKIWESVVSNSRGENRTTGISRQWIEIFNLLDKLIKGLYTNENSSEKIFTEFRKPVRKKYGDNSEIYKQSIYIMGVSQDRSKERKNEYAEKVKQKNKDRRNLPIFYDDEIYKVIDEGINDPDDMKKIIAVMLCTGSRPIEVIKVSNYHKSPKGENNILVKGIAKDRAHKGYENIEIDRPLVRLKSNQIIKAVEILRKNLNINGTNEEIANRYNNRLNDTVKKLFPNQKPTAHKMRYIASNLAYLLYGKGGGENSFVQDFLGHQSGIVSRTYQSINVRLRKDIGGGYDDELKTVISEIKADIETNKEEHKEFKQEIKKEINKEPLIFEEFINNKTRGNREGVIKKLTQLAKKLKEYNVKMTQTLLKQHYNYGSPTISDFYNRIRTGEIVI